MVNKKILCGFRRYITYPMKPHKTCICGTLEGIRTPDLVVRSHTLYPAELTALILFRTFCILAQRRANVNTFLQYFRSETPALHLKIPQRYSKFRIIP